MREVTRRSFVLTVVLAAAGCASGHGAGVKETGPRRRTDFITQEEIEGAHYTNLFDLIQNLRYRWLQSHGPDTILGTPSEVQVHLDDQRLGGVQTLRAIPLTGIAYIQFFDPVSAASRWGAGHTDGVIYVSTRAK